MKKKLASQKAQALVVKKDLPKTTAEEVVELRTKFSPEDLAFIEKIADAPTPPKFHEVKGALELIEDDASALGMATAFQTADAHLSQGLLWQAAQGKTNANSYNFVASEVHSLQPKNGLEAMLCVSITANHNAAMLALANAALADQPLEVAETLTARAIRLQRLVCLQMETLKSLRSKGSRQLMTVRHVDVRDGGQAVIGQLGGKP